eukprot:SAG11_NODE_381_length_9941_cov_11.761885_3_plen_69_part_00
MRICCGFSVIRTARPQPECLGATATASSQWLSLRRLACLADLVPLVAMQIPSSCPLAPALPPPAADAP